MCDSASDTPEHPIALPPTQAYVHRSCSLDTAARDSGSATEIVACRSVDPAARSRVLLEPRL